jgi:hypothetical protein
LPESSTRTYGAKGDTALWPLRTPLRLTMSFEAYYRTSQLAGRTLLSKEVRGGIGLDFVF